ncbi:MAG: hypothetical protein WC604_01370 [Candidatus Gracilibacteria bacterium]
MKNLEQQFGSDAARDVDVGRRRLLGGFAGLAGLLVSSSTAAKVLKVILCQEEGGTGSLIDKACNYQEIDPCYRAEFLKSMRSAPAFEELALKLLLKGVDFSDRRLNMLYPGAGSHIASVMVPAKLMEAGIIDQAEITLTDIEDEFHVTLRNLRLLTKIDPNFELQDPESQQACGTQGGGEDGACLLYRKKPIKIQFLTKCSGEKWFRQEDLDRSNVAVVHDAGEVSINTLKVIAQFFEAKKKSPSKKLAIIMEDMSRSSDQGGSTGRAEDDNFMVPYGREFDLELIGTYMGGTEPYGHRRSQFIPGVVCTRGREPQTVSAELGVPDDMAGCVFEFYPEIFGLTDEEFGLLADIAILAKNPRGYTVMVHGERVNCSGNLRSESTLSDILEKGGKLLDFYAHLDKDLARGFACRIIQCLINFADKYSDLTLQSVVEEKGAHRFFDELKVLFQRIGEVLTEGDINTVQPSLSFIQDFFKRIEDVYPAYMRERTKFERVRDDICGSDGCGGNDFIDDKKNKKFYAAFDRAEGVWEKAAFGSALDSALNKTKYDAVLEHHQELMDGYGDKIFDAVKLKHR